MATVVRAPGILLTRILPAARPTVTRILWTPPSVPSPEATPSGDVAMVALEETTSEVIPDIDLKKHFTSISPKLTHPIIIMKRMDIDPMCLMLLVAFLLLLLFLTLLSLHTMQDKPIRRQKYMALLIESPHGQRSRTGVWSLSCRNIGALNLHILTTLDTSKSLDVLSSGPSDDGNKGLKSTLRVDLTADDRA
jgi:hypothetical protein